MLDKLTDDELQDLYAIYYEQMIDTVEPFVDMSGYVDAIAVIGKIKQNV